MLTAPVCAILGIAYITDFSHGVRTVLFHQVEKMADAKVPVTPTKIGSASPTVPPGTPPQVRTISGAVIGGLSPVSKSHAGVSAGSIVQVCFIRYLVDYDTHDNF